MSYQAVGTTAAVGVDFQLAPGAVTFNAGDPNGATRTLTIAIVNDALDELDESFAVTLIGVTGAQAGSNSRTDVTITDDDPPPTMSINDVALYEGNSGKTSFVFTVNLSAPSAQRVEAVYNTTDGTAVEWVDYERLANVVTIDPGLTSSTITVLVLTDGAYEPNETFQVTLASPANATLADAHGIGTIINDDASRHTWGDFYAPRDGSADGALFNPSTALWAFKDSNTGNTTTFGPFGTSGDKFVPADYTGDGITDCAVYRPSTGQWFVQPSCAPGGQYNIVWGGDPSDVPVAADFDGDGKADLAVYRRSTTWWHILKSSGGTSAIEWGWTWTHVKPVPGDYDGDGRADVAYYAEYNGVWMILQSSTGTHLAIGWGVAGGNVIPTPADYDGDGRTDLAYFYPANNYWYIVPSTTGVGQATLFGLAGDVPVPADYDGDGKFDIASYNPTARYFAVMRSSTGSILTIDMSAVSQVGARPVLRKPQ